MWPRRYASLQQLAKAQGMGQVADALTLCATFSCSRTTMRGCSACNILKVHISWQNDRSSPPLASLLHTPALAIAGNAPSSRSSLKLHRSKYITSMSTRRNKHDGPDTMVTLCSTILLGALIAKNLPPKTRSSADRRPNSKCRTASPDRWHQRDSYPRPRIPRVPPLQEGPYHEQRSYIHYPPERAGETGETLYVIDQRPLGAGWTGPEVAQETVEDEDKDAEEARVSRQQTRRSTGQDAKATEPRRPSYQVRRYYRWNGEEAGPAEPRTTMEKGWPKWD
jgi:hypothetical protein